MKLRALCDAQLSAKSVLSSLLCPAKPPRNAGGAEDGTGSGSTEGSKLDGPFLPKHTETGKGTGGQATAEEPRAAKEFLQNSIFSAAKGSLAVSSTAEGQTTGQKQQLPAFPEVCCRSDADTVTKALQNPGMDRGQSPTSAGSHGKAKTETRSGEEQALVRHHCGTGSVVMAFPQALCEG